MRGLGFTPKALTANKRRTGTVETILRNILIFILANPPTPAVLLPAIADVQTKIMAKPFSHRAISPSRVQKYFPAGGHSSDEEIGRQHATEILREVGSPINALKLNYL